MKIQLVIYPGERMKIRNLLGCDRPDQLRPVLNAAQCAARYGREAKHNMVPPGTTRIRASHPRCVLMALLCSRYECIEPKTKSRMYRPTAGAELRTMHKTRSMSFRRMRAVAPANAEDAAIQS